MVASAAMRYLLPIIGLLALSCGGGKSSTPTSPTPVTAQVAGVWGYTATVTSASGGECLASAFQTAVGFRSSGTIQIQQNGSSLSATTTEDGSGASCSYTGTAGANSLALNLVSCTASDAIGVMCTNGSRRDVRIVTGGVNATVSGGSMSGTQAETYNVLTTFGSPVGIATFNSSFSATKR